MSDRLWLLTIAPWLALVAKGMAALGRYEFTPGRPARQWPTASRVPRERDRVTVILAGHPRCPCTRSTLSELERIHARAPGRFHLQVLFYQPAHPSLEWQSGISWELARALPECAVRPDPESHEARLFDACTSGRPSLCVPSLWLLAARSRSQ